MSYSGKVKRERIFISLLCRPCGFKTSDCFFCISPRTIFGLCLNTGSIYNKSQRKNNVAAVMIGFSSYFTKEIIEYEYLTYLNYLYYI